MAAFDQRKLDDLSKQQGELESKLSSSPTAYTLNTQPTSTDISTDVRLSGVKKAIDTLESQKIRENWYGPNKTDTTGETAGSQEGFFEKGLNALSRPLYAVVGATEAALGKGTRKGFFDNINANMNERETFGNLLQKYNTPQIISAPLGLALDIAFDPVNWVTAGTAAMVPRTVYGLAKGTTEGLTSSVLKKAAKASSFVPFFRKSEMAANLGEKAIQSAEKFDTAVGRAPVLNRAGVETPSMLSSKRFGLFNPSEGRTLGSEVESRIMKLPGGPAIVNAVKYSPMDWTKRQRLLDRLAYLGRSEGTQLARTPGLTNEKLASDIKGAISESSPITGDPFESAIGSIDDATIQGGNALKTDNPAVSKLKDIMNESDYVAQKDPSIGRADTLENSMRLLDEAGVDYEVKDLVKAIEDKSGAMDASQTGVKWYDDLNKAANDYKIKNVPVFKKTMDVYKSFINLFKTSKIGLSPAAYTNAVAGNPAMYAMIGGDLLDPKWYGSIKDMFNVVRGKAGEDVLAKTFFNDANKWDEFIKQNPGEFTKTYGFDPRYIGAKYWGEAAKRTGKDLGLYTAQNADEFRQSLEEALAETKSNIASAASKSTKERGVLGDVIDESFKQKSTPVTTPYEYAMSMMKDGKVSAADLPSGYAANELIDSNYLNQAKKFIAEKAKTEGGVGYKVLDAMLNKSMKGYERIDQTFKLGTASHLVKNGVSEDQLIRMSRVVPIEPDDILNKYKDAGEYKYRLTPAKATEIANEIYLNYAAMPGAVKVLRSMPIFGAPFVSFLYGMTNKVGKTLLHNTSLFNKTNFLLNEISGAKSPLEKKALESKYNSYLNDPGMVKLPFFKENPVYLNVANMIPYYTMNMFNPSERKYQQTLPGEFLQAMDKFPLFDDPVGQVIFDYFIQPTILKNETPVGQFGQPLYPRDANAIQKLGYAARSVAEAPVPGIAGYLGLVTPESVADLAPSYRWRQIARAKAGKDVLGATTKESALSRTVRSMASNAGIQLHPLELTYLSNTVKKNIKK